MIARALALSVLVAPSIALAQDAGVPNEPPAGATTDDDALRAEARELFESAVPLLEERRFDEAVDPLRRSLELFPNLPTAFNLGVALAHVGETQAAIELFESILGGAHGELSDTQRADTAAMLRQARTELATLRIRASGAPAIRIDIDGQHVGDVVGGAELAWRLDAGEHTVAASADGFVPIEETVTLRRGQRRRVTLTLGETALAGPGAHSSTDPPILGSTGDPAPPTTGGLSTTAALWIGAGAAIAIAAAVAIVVIANTDQTADPVTDPVLPIVETLSF